jgi:hypothetical protein
MRNLRTEEEWARATISRTLGVRVKQHDDGSQPRMHDLVIEYLDRPSASVEVTSSVDSESLELWQLMNGREARWQVDGLRGGWLVALTPSARHRRIRAELPDLLLELEAKAIRHLEPTDMAGRTFDKIASDLGVASAWQSRETAFPGSVYLTIEQPLDKRVGYVSRTGNALATWLGDFLQSPAQADVLAKLARSGAAERHAFVLVASFTTASFSVVDLLIRRDAPLPTVPPELPNEVTDVWVASTWSNGLGFRWSPRSGWLTFDKEMPA